MPIIPKLRRQRRKGKPDTGFVEIDGKRIGLGPWGSVESRERYQRVLAEMSVGGTGTASPDRPLVVELTTAFFAHLERNYKRPATGTTSEVSHYRQALKPVNELYGRAHADSFGPLQLRAVRQRMVDDLEWSRRYVNVQVARVKRCFKWAVAEGMVPPAVFHGLAVVDGLRHGRTDAKELPPVQPVEYSIVDATLEHVTPTLRALVSFIRYTGCRVGEGCRLRMADVDMSSGVWAYKPSLHKGSWRAGQRVVLIGPKARQAIAEYTKTTGYLFSPKQSEVERLDTRHAARKTPLSCGNKPGSNRKTAPRKQPGECFQPGSVNHAIGAACRKAFPLPSDVKPGSDEAREWERSHRWTALQLRHSLGTAVRAKHGIEASRVLLGHADVATSEIYSERDLATAIKIAKRIG